MNLILDKGNSFVKLAVFEEGSILLVSVVEAIDLEKEIKKINIRFPQIVNVIISSVSSIDASLQDLVNYFFDNILVVSSELHFPFINKYKTPKTLGVDRLGLVSGASMMYKNQNVLVIDSGTCITYDFKNDKNEYLGGAIGLGLNMRYKALKDYTYALPLLEPKENCYLIGVTTSTSIHSGVVNGLISEIDGIINRYKANYEDLTVILTGGDANFLSKQLKSSIFANSNFLLEGLNYLLNFNLKK